jgi:hypothetical protein
MPFVVLRHQHSPVVILDVKLWKTESGLHFCGGSPRLVISSDCKAAHVNVFRRITSRVHEPKEADSERMNTAIAKVWLETVRLDGLLGGSRDEKLIGGSRLVALVKPLHSEMLLAPVGELERPCLWRDQIMLT